MIGNGDSNKSISPEYAKLAPSRVGATTDTAATLIVPVKPVSSETGSKPIASSRLARLPPNLAARMKREKAENMSAVAGMQAASTIRMAATKTPAAAKSERTATTGVAILIAAVLEAASNEKWKPLRQSAQQMFRAGGPKSRHTSHSEAHAKAPDAAQ